MTALEKRSGIPFDLYPQNVDQGRQWFAALNVGDQEIPPFGMVQLCDADGGDRLDRERQISRQGQVIWYVKRPNADGAASGNPGRFAINGPFSIRAGHPQSSVGRVSWSWPMQVLWDGLGPIAPGWMCGPGTDTFSVVNGGRGFVCLSHDAAGTYRPELANLAAPGYDSTIWIMPAHSIVPCLGTWKSAGIQTVSSNACITEPEIQQITELETYSGQSLLWCYNFRNVQFAYDFEYEGVTRTGVQIPVSGVYMYSLSAMIWSTATNNRGDLLAIQLLVYRNRAPSSSANLSPFTGRFQDVEQDDGVISPTVTRETVSISGYLLLEAGDILSIINAGVDISYSNLHFSLVRVHDILYSPNVDFVY